MKTKTNVKAGACCARTHFSTGQLSLCKAAQHRGQDKADPSNGARESREAEESENPKRSVSLQEKLGHGKFTQEQSDGAEANVPSAPRVSKFPQFSGQNRTSPGGTA